MAERDRFSYPFLYSREKSLVTCNTLAGAVSKWRRVGENVALLMVKKLLVYHLRLIRNLALVAGVGLTLATCALGQFQSPPYDWSKLPSNTWVKLPTTGAIPGKIFHGGMTLDSDCGLLLLFGSESHERSSQYDNSVRRLDLKTLVWSQDYPPDPISSYTRSEEGVLATTFGRPWGEHSFDVVDYVPPLRKMVVVQWPAHAFLFPEHLRGARPTTWLYDPATKRWQALPAESPNLFAASTVYDPHTQRLVGYGGYTTSIFDWERAEWLQHKVSGGPRGYHLSMEYDPVLRRVLAFGNHEGSNELYALDVVKLRWEKIETPTKPPGASGAAIAYSTHAKALLLLAPASGVHVYSNADGASETWVFDSVIKDWRMLDIPSPPVFGMNYHKAYDVQRNVFLYGERGEGVGPQGGPLAIWALRYVPGTESRPAPPSAAGNQQTG